MTEDALDLAMKLAKEIFLGLDVPARLSLYTMDPVQYNSIIKAISHPVSGDQNIEVLEDYSSINQQIKTQPAKFPISKSSVKRGTVREGSAIASFACTSFSGVARELFSLLFIWQIQHAPVKLHHIGFRYVEDTYREIAMQKRILQLKTATLCIDGDEHDQYFIPIGDHWIEYQKWKKNVLSNGFHVDIGLENLDGFATFVKMTTTDVNVIYLDKAPHSPYIKIGTYDTNFGEFSFMLRSLEDCTSPASW